MTQRFRETLRNAIAQAVIDDLGANFKVKFYNGTQPASVATALSGNTLLATLTADGTPGSVSASATFTRPPHVRLVREPAERRYIRESYERRHVRELAEARYIKE